MAACKSRSPGSAVVISISASLLTAYYNARAGIGTGAASSSASSTAAPTPPWQSTSTAPQQATLVKSVLGGAPFMNTSATQLSAPSGTSAANYNNLFALYQGVNALQGLAKYAGTAGITTAQSAQYATAFASGMTQLQTFLNQTSFPGMAVTAGTYTATDQTKEGATVETDGYTTGTVFSGTTNQPVPALAGNVQFAMTATNTKGVATQVNFDLSEMGDTPRTMGNVVNYLNSQLYTMGLTTRFKTVDTPVAPVTTTVNGKTVTLSTPPDNIALSIVGSPTEKLTFSAASAPAVYVTGTSGTAAAAATSLTPAVTGDQTQQLMKFDTSATTASTAVTSDTTMQAAVSSALASATGPDGSLYVLTNVNSTTADGQTINGSQDVALMKYDSAGNLLYTRTLGAANSASGYALAVSADGSKVAIAGSVTGPLDADNSGESATSTNSFVSEYDTAMGDEDWTNTQASKAGDAATGVAFGADGSVYVTGTTQSALPSGGGEVGGQDGYLRGYTPSGTISFTNQFGTTGTDKPAGIAVSGSSVYVAGMEGGDAVVRQFDISTPGVATAGAVRDLGSLQGGNVVGVGVNTDGSVVVAGSTSNGALSAGTVTNAYQSGREAFVANLGADLQPASSDALTYVQTSGNLTASAMTMSGGQVYLAGQVATTASAGSGLTNTSNGYLAAIDPTSGAVTWSQSFQGADGKAAATSIAVDPTGSSVLDALGLPTTINYAQSTLLVSNTSVRAGDTFSIKNGSGVAQTVTIDDADTLQTLAQKIQRASGFTVTATTVTVKGETQLKIAASNNSTTVQLIPGAVGKDALSGLGLTPGVLNQNAGQVSTASHKATVTLGLNLLPTMNLNSPTSITAAQTALALASAKIQNAYQTLVTPFSASKTATTSTPSKFVTDQIANYQSALSWLQNNEGTSSPTTLLF